jgi:hypothetical protein
MASSIPRQLKKALTDGWAAETLYVALFNKNYTIPSDGKYSVTNEASGTGYTAGGVALSTKTSAYTETTNAVLDAGDTVFSGVLFVLPNAPRFAVVYETATNLIRGVFDLGGDRVVSPQGTLTILWSASGIIKVS